MPLFEEIKPEAVKKLGALTRIVSFPAGAKIVEMGESGLSLFVILEGRFGCSIPARGVVGYGLRMVARACRNDPSQTLAVDQLK